MELQKLIACTLSILFPKYIITVSLFSFLSSIKGSQHDFFNYSYTNITSEALEIHFFQLDSHSVCQIMTFFYESHRLMKSNLHMETIVSFRKFSIADSARKEVMLFAGIGIELFNSHITCL